METSILLARLLGLALVIIGGALALRSRYFIPVMGAIAEERFVRAIFSIMELIAGLAILLTHPFWEPAPAAIITLIGWIMALEGTMYLLLPDAAVSAYIRFFSNRFWYIAGGLLMVAVGLYLSMYGFRNNPAGS